jgi:hypothetical protein
LVTHMPVFIVSVFTRHAILCLLQNNLCPAPHLHPRPGHKYYPGRKADLRPQDPSLRLLLFVPHNICRFYGFINGVLQCPTLVLSPIPKPCCQNKESYKTKKGRTMTVRAVTVGRNARFFQEHSPLTGHGMGKLVTPRSVQPLMRKTPIQPSLGRRMSLSTSRPSGSDSQQPSEQKRFIGA